MYKTLAMTATAIALAFSMPAYADDAAGIDEEQIILASGEMNVTEEGVTEDGALTDDEAMAEDEATAEDGDLLEEDTAETGQDSELDNPAIGEDQPGVITGEDVEDEEPGAGRGSTE